MWRGGSKPAPGKVGIADTAGVGKGKGASVTAWGFAGR